jgi:hypothetical protein
MRILAIITLAVMAIGLSACAPKEQPAPAPEKTGMTK